MTLDDWHKKLWAHATRGLFGIIIILENFETHDLTKAPTNDFIAAAKRLNELAQRVLSKNHEDNSSTYSK